MIGDTFKAKLIGGGGELYNTNYYNIYFSQKLKFGSVRNFISQFMTESPYVKKSFVNIIRDLLEEVLNSMIGDTVQEKLETHYLFYRNRFHFGMSSLQWELGEGVFQPFMSRALLSASWKLSIKDRASSIVHNRVINRLYSDLNSFPYYSDLENNPTINSKLIYDISRWKKAQDCRRFKSQEDRQNFYSFRRDFDQLLFHEAKNAISKLYDFCPSIKGSLTDYSLNMVNEGLNFNQSSRKFQYSKTLCYKLIALAAYIE